jgi:hypothetical protein
MVTDHQGGWDQSGVRVTSAKGPGRPCRPPRVAVHPRQLTCRRGEQAEQRKWAVSCPQRIAAAISLPQCRARASRCGPPALPPHARSARRKPLHHADCRYVPPNSNALASDVTAPLSNAATTSRPSTGANNLGYTLSASGRPAD